MTSRQRARSKGGDWVTHSYLVSAFVNCSLFRTLTAAPQLFFHLTWSRRLHWKRSRRIVRFSPPMPSAAFLQGACTCTSFANSFFVQRSSQFCNTLLTNPFSCRAVCSAKQAVLLGPPVSRAHDGKTEAFGPGKTTCFAEQPIQLPLAPGLDFTAPLGDTISKS